MSQNKTCQEGSGVVALMFLNSNKTVKPFPPRDAQGITIPSRQLADPYGEIPSLSRRAPVGEKGGDIYDSKKPLINRAQVYKYSYLHIPLSTYISAND